MTEQESKPYEVETVVDAPREVVWRSITSPELIHQWFGWDYEDLEGEIRFIFVEHGKQEPPDRLVVDNGNVIELVADGPRTIVRVVMPGDLTDAKWDDIYDGMEEGWRTFLEQLRFYLGHRLDHGERRTIYLTGVGTGTEAARALPAGELWHESRYQRITLDADGLLVGVAAQQPMDVKGPVSLTVTTYGLPDAAFAELEKDWITRWSEVTEPEQPPTS